MAFEIVSIWLIVVVVINCVAAALFTGWLLLDKDEDCAAAMSLSATITNPVVAMMYGFLFRIVMAPLRYEYWIMHAASKNADGFVTVCKTTAVSRYLSSSLVPSDRVKQ